MHNVVNVSRKDERVTTYFIGLPLSDTAALLYETKMYDLVDVEHGEWRATAPFGKLPHVNMTT